MSNVKLQWTQPQLIVLARGTPEESVLTFCKYIGAGTNAGAYNASQDSCAALGESSCANCQARADKGS